MDGDELYIETFVPTDVDDLWDATQQPDQHERWDLRFTDIEYLPREDDEPQRFEYATRIGFGLGVEGRGESTADRDAGDEHVSALRFWSDDRLSLIEEGTGYWRYVPEAGGVRFLTGYNYRVRFGTAGRLVDRLFRPLMVWATAWSFDRLRMWVVEDVSPEASMRAAVSHGVARVALALVWVYAGLVPKLLGPHSEELALSRAAAPGVPAETAVLALGAAEVAFGLALLVGWHRRWLFVTSALGTVAVVAAGLVARPGLAAHPLSPLPLGFAMLGLAAVGYASGADLPRAGRCITTREASGLQWAAERDATSDQEAET